MLLATNNQALELNKQIDSLQAVVDHGEDESGEEDQDYGSNQDNIERRSGNERAVLIRATCKKKVCNMQYEELYDLVNTFSEIVLSMDVPYREEFLDHRTEAYPLISTYRKLDHYTVCRVVLDLQYFESCKRKEMRRTLGQEEYKEFAQTMADLKARHFQQLKVRKRLIAEFSARPPEARPGLLCSIFSWFVPSHSKQKQKAWRAADAGREGRSTHHDDLSECEV